MTSSGPRLKPRKQPRQTRAHETRERIIDAAARIFARHGYAAGTTNRIAADADLSVGSLYQYFPNKDAILVELVHRHAASGFAALNQRVTDGLPGSLDGRVAVFVDAVIDNHRGDGRLHQVLFEEAPRPAQLLDELHAIERTVVAALTELLRGDADVAVPDVDLAARMTVMTIESLVHRFVASGPSDGEFVPFRDELIRMITGYLRGTH